MQPDLLYDPARHEQLRPIPWDESQVLTAIEYIVADTESRFTEDRHWPLHPLDRELLGFDFGDAHEYRILGLMNAYEMSTIRLMITKTNATNRIPPSITG